MREGCYQVLFAVGSFSVTVLHVGMVVYLLLIGGMFLMVRSAYS